MMAKDDAITHSGERPSRRHRRSLVWRVWIISVVLELISLAIIAALFRDAATVVPAIVVATLAAVAIHSSIFAFLDRRLRREARGIARTARRLAATNFNYQPGRPTIRELAELTVTLDGMARQLSERLSELNAQRSEQAAILRSIHVGVIALDSEQRVLSVNRSARDMLEMPPGDVRGRLLQEIASEPDLNQFVADALDDPADCNAEFQLMSRRDLTVRATSGELHDAQNAVVGVVIVLNNVTKLRRLESMRTDFAANVSHELRTPMTNIKGYVETMLDMDLEDREQARSFLKVIARNANRLGAIVEDMMSLARLERVESLDVFDPKPIRMRELCDAVVNSIKEEIQGKGMAVVNEVPQEDRAYGNAQMVEQALLNLILNGVKYSPPGTRIWVRARHVSLDPTPVADGDDTAMVGEHGLAVSVVDEGPGIGPEHQDRIFERFYRVDKARSREAGGTGLGLAIVKHIALVHGGRVGVQSSPGAGSTFTIVLPIPH